MQQEKLINRFNEILILSVASGRSADALTLAVKQWLYDIRIKYYEQIRYIDPVMLKTSIVKSIVREVMTIGYSPLTEKDFSDDKIQDALLHHQAKEQEGIEVSKILNDAPDKELQKELADGVFISNAGAVIIAAFLPTLFSRTGLLQENKITDIDTALYLLHYCITGNTDPAEFELLFLKILCGNEVTGSGIRITLSATSSASFSCGSSGLLTVSFAWIAGLKNEDCLSSPKKLSSPALRKKVCPLFCCLRLILCVFVLSAVVSIL